MISMKRYYPLLDILQSALFGKSIEDLHTDSLVDVLAEAEKQAVVPITFQVLSEIGMKLPSVMVFQQVGIQHQVIQRNTLLNEQLVFLTQLFQKYNVDYAIVKGQVAASYYPEPKFRQSGDVDFFCDEKNYVKAINAIQREWGINVENGNGEYHDAFDFHGVSYELHHTLTHFYNKNKDYYWKTILSKAPCYSVNINGCNVSTLHPTIHSLYIFMHFYHHLLELGVGLRQFCDWAMILHACKDKIDHKAIKKHLKVFGMEKAYRACGAILVRDLGLPADEFTYELTDYDMRYADKILDVVFYRGNMGHYNKRSGFHGWRHKLESTGIKLSHFFKFYPLAPSFMRDLPSGVVKRIYLGRTP